MHPVPRLPHTPVILAVLMASAITGCGHRETPGRSVVVSIAPQKYLVDHLTGGTVPVTVLVPAGQDPHTFEPLPAQMAAIADAQVFFTAGMPFEEVLAERIAKSTPGLAIVDVTTGIPRRRPDSPALVLEGTDEEPGDSDHHDHDHEGDDPHLWLDPVFARMEARIMAEALAAADTTHRADIMANLAALEASLDSLTTELQALLVPLAGTSFMVFHPSWGYFADRFGLVQVPIEIEGKEPTPAQMARLIDLARERGIRTVFVQPQFNTRQAEAIARELGGVALPLDGLAEEYPAALRKAAHAIAEGVQ